MQNFTRETLRSSQRPFRKFNVLFTKYHLPLTCVVQSCKSGARSWQTERSYILPEFIHSLSNKDPLPFLCRRHGREKTGAKKRWNFSSQYLFSKQPGCSITNQGTRQWWQLLQAVKHTWTQSWSAAVKVMTLVVFQPIGIFRFWRNGEFTFFQRCLQPLNFSRSPSPTRSASSLAITSARSTIA